MCPIINSLHFGEFSKCAFLSIKPKKQYYFVHLVSHFPKTTDYRCAIHLARYTVNNCSIVSGRLVLIAMMYCRTGRHGTRRVAATLFGAFGIGSGSFGIVHCNRREHLSLQPRRLEAEPAMINSHKCVSNDDVY